MNYSAINIVCKWFGGSRNLLLKLSRWLFLISCGCFSVPAISAEPTGQAILAQYKGEKPYPAPNANVGKALAVEFASGYLSGIIDSYEGEKWCNTHGIAAGELKAYVQDYIENLSPSKRGRPVRQLIGEALKKRYPCR